MCQMQLAPPGQVGEVAERAHHDQARALLGVRERVGVHGHLDAEEGRAHGPADERCVPGVGRVADYATQRDHADTLRQRGWALYSRHGRWER